MNIQATDDHGQFKTIKGNREIKRAHVNRLYRSMVEKPELTQYSPIIVNKDNEVIDGQHRLEALRKAGLPVHYIQAEGLNLKDIQAMNSSSKTWSMLDYAKSYAALGNKHYQKYLEFLDLYPKLGNFVIATYLSLNTSLSKIGFNDGKLKVEDEEKSHDLCRALLDIGKYNKDFNSKVFSMAFKRIWSSENYDHERMLKKIKRQGNDLPTCTNQEDYARVLESLHNHGLAEKNRVRFF